MLRPHNRMQMIGSFTGFCKLCNQERRINQYKAANDRITQSCVSCGSIFPIGGHVRP